jgi:16S rRNA G966 N2-methylase RsmD
MSTQPYAAKDVATGKRLLAEEREFASKATKNAMEATVRAFHFGKILWTQVLGGRRGKRGEGTLQRYLDAVGFGKHHTQARRYMYLYLGARWEGRIRTSGLPRKYFEIIGSGLGEPGVLSDEWFDYLIEDPLLTEDGEPDLGLLEQVVDVIKDARARARLRLGSITTRLVPIKRKVLRSGRPEQVVYDGKREELCQLQADEAKLQEDVFKLIGRPDECYWLYPERLTHVNETFALLRKAGVDFNPTSHKENVTAKGIVRKRTAEAGIQKVMEAITPPVQKHIDDKVFHGRCEAVLMDKARFPLRSVDVVITDPPYTQEFYAEKRPEKVVEHDQEKTASQQAALLAKVASILLDEKIAKRQFAFFAFCPLAAVYIFMPPLVEVFRRHGGKCQVLVWDKQTTPPVGGNQLFVPSAEAILYCNVNRTLSQSDERGQRGGVHSMVLPFKCETEDGCWKPPSLIRHLLWLTTYGDLKDPAARGQVVLDPFAGGGSTAMAAIGLDRDYRMIESHDGQLAKLKKNVAKALKNRDGGAE